MNEYSLSAKQAVETYIKENKTMEVPDDLSQELLNQKAGVFVTIENKGDLRGCIGTYLPTQKNIAQEIIHNAIAAATEDYRFSPIQEKELPQLSYTVYVLEKPESVENIDDLDPKKYGIIIKSGEISAGTDVIFNPSPSVRIKSGLLLPGLEGVKTVEQQISITCQKAGIDLKKEKITIYRFKAQKYE